MFAAHTFGELAFGLERNTQETLTASPEGDYVFVQGVPIDPITLTIDDPDGGDVTLRFVSGSLPPGLTINRVLPYTDEAPYTATISGNPATFGNYSVTYESDDLEGSTAQLQLNFLITTEGESDGEAGTGSFRFFRRNPGMMIR